MATFTDDEISAVIERLVRSTVRRPYDTLGTRRTDVTFNDVQEAAAGVFLLYQRTPFFFASLAGQRLREEVEAAGIICVSLIDTIEVLKRRVLPVKDTSSLANARAALLELEATVSTSGPPRDISTVPAYIRFNSNVDRFLGTTGNNIKSQGSIVPTPHEARTMLPGLVAQLQAAMESIVVRVGFIANAIEDYADVNLPKLLSSGIISRARQVLDTRLTQLEKMTETSRLEVLRETILELLGTKAVVRQFGSFTPPASLVNLTGTGSPFSDSDRPANEAFLDSDNPGPYALVADTDEATSTNVLRLYVDGAPSYPSAPTTTFFLPQSAVAHIDGLNAGPFNIVGGTNDSLVAEIAGVTYPIPLTAGGARTPAQVAADITSGLTGTNFQGEAYFFPLMFDGEVQASGNDIELAFGSFPSNSINVGDEVDFYFGPDAPTTRIVTAVNPSLVNPETITVNGGALTTGAARVRYGSPSRRVRISAIDKLQSVQDKETIFIRTPTAVEIDTGITLGMYGELFGRSLPTDAELVANYVTANSRYFRAATYFTAAFSDALLRSIPSDSFGVVLYNVRGDATWGSGTTGVTVTLDEDPEQDVTGMTIVLREGNEPDAVGLITAQTDEVLTVDFASAVTATSGLVEIGPTSGIEEDMVVLVDDGKNEGRFFISTIHDDIPFQFKLREQMPVFRDGFNEPVFMTGSVGTEGVRFFSKTKDLTSEIEIYDPLTVFMSSAGPTNEVGTTNYFELPSKPSDLEEGDFLEFHTTSYETPAFEREITQLYSDAVVKLGEAIDSTVSYPFGMSEGLPFVQLRTDRIVSFETFSEQLLGWLENDDVDVRAYFIDLARFIQPLLVNENPTASDVGSAENRVRDLHQLLTIAGAQEVETDEDATLEAILASFEAPYVPQADALVRAFKEKGADRAVDLLLDCRFTTFFGLDQEEVSYAGSFQKAVREVARNDLPVRKVDRLSATISPLRATIESPDYETETPDLDDAPNIDPPVAID